MEQRLNFITLGVPDVAAARRFYVDGLGWEPTLEVEDEVRRIMDAAAEAGATVLKAPERSPDFNGLHGHFADPAGFRWEIAHNPGWRVDPDGRAHLGPS